MIGLVLDFRSRHINVIPIMARFREYTQIVEFINNPVIDNTIISEAGGYYLVYVGTDKSYYTHIYNILKNAILGMNKCMLKYSNNIPYVEVSMRDEWLSIITCIYQNVGYQLRNVKGIYNNNMLKIRTLSDTHRVIKTYVAPEYFTQDVSGCCNIM